MKIVIIDGCGSNITSLKMAFKKVLKDPLLEKKNVEILYSNNIKDITSADKVILPGVGYASYAMKKLNLLGLVETIQNLKVPVFGICLGMQLLFNKSSESEGEKFTNCLGVIDCNIHKIEKKINFPVPHMGWNKIYFEKKSKLLNNIKEGEYFYFVHSFYAKNNDFTVAKANYSNEVSAIVEKNNFYGCQFHPEKSGKAGEQIIRNFLTL